MTDTKFDSAFPSPSPALDTASPEERGDAVYPSLSSPELEPAARTARAASRSRVLTRIPAQISMRIPARISAGAPTRISARIASAWSRPGTTLPRTSAWSWLRPWTSTTQPSCARLRRCSWLRRFRPTGGGIYAASVAATGITSVVFHVLATRTLGPASYGAFGSLLAVLMMLAVPIGAIQILLTARIGRLAGTAARVDLRPLTLRVGVVGCIATVAVCLAGPATARYLHLPGSGPLLWLGVYFIPLALGVVPWGFLRGTGRLGWVRAASTAGFGVRLGVGALLLTCGFGVSGAMAAMFLGECVLAAILGVGACHVAAQTNVGIPRPRGSRFVPRSAAAVRLDLTPGQAGRRSLSVMGLWALFGVDLVMARHSLAPEAAGVYTATALASRAVLTVAHTAATASLRRFAAASERRAAAALRTTLLVAVAAGALGACLLVAVGPQVLGLLFGRAFAADAGLDLLLGLDGMVLAAVSVLIQFRLARHARAAVAGWAGSLCFVACSRLLPMTPVGLAAALGAGALCALTIAAAQALARSAASGGGSRFRGPRPDPNAGLG